MICETCPFATIIRENTLNDSGTVDRRIRVKCSKKRIDVDDGREICSDYTEHPIQKSRLTEIVQNVRDTIGKGSR